MFKYYNLLWVFLGATILIFISVPDYKIIKLKNGGKEIIEQDTRNGVVQTFYSNGQVKTSITYKQNIKEGEAIMYYSNGNVHLQMTFINGKRECFSKKNYKNGTLYALTPYINDKITGTRKLYYSDGQLKAEVPYFNNLQGIGLGEFTTSGKPTVKPRIAIEPGVYIDEQILKFSVSDCYKESFYIGRLKDNQFLDLSDERITPLPSTEGYHYSKMENIKAGDEVICSCTTTGGNQFIATIKIPTTQLIN